MITSVSPNVRRSTVAPLLVRIDTPEMTEQAQCYMSLRERCELPSPTSTISMATSFKRYYEGDEGRAEVFTSSKRRKPAPRHNHTELHGFLADQKQSLPSCGITQRIPPQEIQSLENVQSVSSMQSLASNSSVLQGSNERNSVRKRSSIGKQDNVSFDPRLSQSLASRPELYGQIAEDLPLPTPQLPASLRNDTVRYNIYSRNLRSRPIGFQRSRVQTN